MTGGVNSQKLFYAISSFFLVVLIIFTLKINYASSASSENKTAGHDMNDGGNDACLKSVAINRSHNSPSIEAEKSTPDITGSIDDTIEPSADVTEPVAEAVKTVSVKSSKKTRSAKNLQADPAAVTTLENSVSVSGDAISSIISIEKIKKMPGYYSIVVNKSDYTLTLYKDGTPVKTYKIAIGRNPDGANKKARGDLRTPEGNFYIVSIHKSDKWLHEGKYAYGPWFLRLKTPWQGIGIHGTDEPETLGSKASEGCIRMKSEHVTELKKLIEEQVKNSGKKVAVDIVAGTR